MIISFADADSCDLFHGKLPKRFGALIRRKMLDKLQILHAARDLNDLRVPPGNRLEALSGRRSGQYFIRVNDQWRICFRWRDGSAYDVMILDYH